LMGALRQRLLTAVHMDDFMPLLDEILHSQPAPQLI
jgi:hypothetical protein